MNNDTYLIQRDDIAGASVTVHGPLPRIGDTIVMYKMTFHVRAVIHNLRTRADEDGHDMFVTVMVSP